jgi:cysteine desulfuration protein SufE
MALETMDLDELVDNFELLDDWSERYRYIIELGRRLPPMDDALKTAESKVDGCMSQVWLVGRREADTGALQFVADSDAHIVRGLIAILLVLFSGKSAEEILAIDPAVMFTRLGLDTHLSPGRSNGLMSMVRRVKTLAAHEGASAG